MAKKDFDKYYYEVCAVYLETKENLKDFSELASQNLFPPERLEEIKEAIKPLMQNYERLSYVKYLLDLPTNKKSKKRYERQQKKILDRCKKTKSTKEDIAQENRACLDKVDELKKVESN